jgi:hypothetical protein
MKKKLNGLNHDSKNREEAKKQGFYDGRFRNKVVPDKKKEENKNAAKKFRGKDSSEL